jgi:hypothetical protein
MTLSSAIAPSIRFSLLIRLRYNQKSGTLSSLKEDCSQANVEIPEKSDQSHQSPVVVEK